MKEDKRKYNGGNKNAGRKPKVDEEKANNIMVEAIKEFYSKDTEDDAKKELVKTLLESQRGQIFVSEHVFGKPKEKVENTHTLNNFNIKDIIQFKQ